jgi:hypothetical protein
MLMTTALVAAIAAGVALAKGADPALLGDPARSPIFRMPLWMALMTIPVQGALLASLGLWLFLLKPSLPKVLPLAPPKPTQLAGALLVVFGLAPLASAVGEFVQWLREDDFTTWDVVARAARHATMPELALLLFALACLPAIGEEAMFRGLIMAPFLRVSKTAGMIIPSIMFGVFHVEPVQMSGTIVLGFGFALARIWSGSLVPGAVAHFIYNGTLIMWGRYSAEEPTASMSVLPVTVGLVVSLLGALILFKSRPLGMNE